MIALMGTLSELGKEDLLDSIMHLCGVSGSTWCMSLIYEDIYWSKNIQDHENKLKEYCTKPPQNPMSMWEKLKNTFDDEVYSLTALWSYLVAKHIIKQINENTLSNHKKACENGANPYPIYAAVEKSNIVNDKKHSPGTWFEFTPHDAGFPDFGAFIRTEVVGSQFNKGDLATIKAEQTICYLQGLWGSALADKQKTKAYIKDFISSWFRGDNENEEDDEYVMRQSEQKCSCDCCLAAEFLMGLSVEELESEVGQNALVRLEGLLEGESSRSAAESSRDKSARPEGRQNEDASRPAGTTSSASSRPSISPPQPSPQRQGSPQSPLTQSPLRRSPTPPPPQSGRRHAVATLQQMEESDEEGRGGKQSPIGERSNRERCRSASEGAHISSRRRRARPDSPEAAELGDSVFAGLEGNMLKVQRLQWKELKSMHREVAHMNKHMHRMEKGISAMGENMSAGMERVATSVDNLCSQLEQDRLARRREREAPGLYQVGEPARHFNITDVSQVHRHAGGDGALQQGCGQGDGVLDLSARANAEC
ncbi:uncharacterized protein LOC144755650 isoform X3 [Lissotriton helveticus]